MCGPEQAVNVQLLAGEGNGKPPCSRHSLDQVSEVGRLKNTADLSSDRALIIIIIYIYIYVYHHHHHHHRLTAVLSRQTRVSRFPPYHPSPPITVISILNNKAQWLHIHLDGVHPCFLGSS